MVHQRQSVGRCPMSSQNETDRRDSDLAEFTVKDPEEFARNLALAVEAGGQALIAFLKPREDGQARSEAIAEQASEIMKTVGQIGEYWSSDPARMMEAQTRLWGNYLTIWNSALRRAAGEAPEPEITPDENDKRFADPQWSDNPMFDALKQIYLATSRWAQELVEGAEGVDEHTRHKARFYIEQISNALAPTNFPMTNPEVLRETASSNAQNLVKGMRMLAEDIEAGKGSLRLRQSDSSRFKVGENLANTPGKVIYQNDICQIIQYASMTGEVLKRPLLIVPPWINKFYVLDLNPDGIFLSNGPGDPQAVDYAVKNVRELVEKKPVFGICLGHQIMALALGARTFKLKFGHHGGNHPVMNVDSGRVEITAQNHGFAVDPESLNDEEVRITHLNLNDQTVEGFEHRSLPVFSVQYHPEASPGPHDSYYLFQKFFDQMHDAKTH